MTPKQEIAQERTDGAEDRTDWAEDRTDWAEDRTDWAEDRTIFAMERTFAGWIRTGLAMVAVALGLHAVFLKFEPTWLPKAVATLFLLASIGTYVAAWGETRKTRERLNRHAAEGQSIVWLTALTVMLSLGTIGIGAVLWLL